MASDTQFPGVFIDEVYDGGHPIDGVSTSETAFVDFFASGPLDEATRIVSVGEFESLFGGLDSRSEASYAVQQYFPNGGKVAWVVRVSSAHEPLSSEWIDGEGADAILGRRGEHKGVYALKGTGFNILCLPAAANLAPASLKTTYDEAARFCNNERAFLIIDIPPAISSLQSMTNWLDSTNADAITRDKNAAVYFPRLTIRDPLCEGSPRNVGASGTMAGLYARTDEERGVWKPAAGIDAGLRDVQLVATLTDVDNGVLNPLGINALRRFPVGGIVSWGARTLEGADQLASEWKYIPVRRMAIYLERSIDEGTTWTVFEPNDESLWVKIRLCVGAFMQHHFRRGAFQGITQREAYFVKCDSETTTQNDINLGVVNILVGFAPLKPAEFVVIKIQKMAGRIEP